MIKQWLNVYDIHAICSRMGAKKGLADIFTQMNHQLFLMAKGKFRRPSILKQYEAFVRHATKLDGLEDDVEISNFIQEIKNDINSEIELLIHDGKSWEATLPPQYRSSFNAIFNTAFYNMFALDLIRGYLPTDPAREYMHVDSIDLEHVVSTSANNLKGLSIEKFGVFPEIAIRTSQDSEGELFLGVEPYVHFAFVEILKNSIQAVIDRHGELEIDNLDEPPIRVDLSASGNLIRAEVRDDGLGLPTVDYSGRDYNPFDALFTSKVNTEPTYTYSRDFGVEFSGKGIGLLKSKLYVEMHLGVLELQSPPTAGCTVTITLPRHTLLV